VEIERDKAREVKGKCNTAVKKMTYCVSGARVTEWCDTVHACHSGKSGNSALHSSARTQNQACENDEEENMN
jgi:hypothetical protein